ncbi:MAG: hypothetical protein AB1566_10850 [Chloroflexota bacterium]
MSAEVFENQLRGYNAVLGALGALAQDICVDCLMIKGAKVRLGKGLKKLETDIAGTALSADKKRELTTQVQRFVAVAEALSQAAEYT